MIFKWELKKLKKRKQGKQLILVFINQLIGGGGAGAAGIVSLALA